MNDTLHVYTRVSTVAQVTDGTSLQTQAEIGIKRAEGLGFDYKVWNEGGKSSDSDNLNFRPVFLELCNQIEKGKIKHIFVYDPSRISRNDFVASAFRTRCSKYGVTLYTKDGKYDFTNPTDKLVQQVLDAISQFDNSLRTDRFRLGKMKRVREGCWHGGVAVFGYKIENKRLVIEPKESEWVKRIFKLYNDGKSPAKIKQELDSNGVKTRRGNVTWTIGSIQALLKNTHYVGQYVVTDSATKETIEVKCPQIIDETLWNSVQVKSKRSSSRVSQLNRTKNFYLLRDIMYCGHCNKPIRGKINNKANIRVYYCGFKEESWRNKGKSDTPWERNFGCGLSRSLNIAETDKLIWDTALKIHRGSSILKEQFKKMIQSDKFNTEEENQEKQQKLQKKISQLTRTRTGLTKTLADINIKHAMKTMGSDLYKQMSKGIDEEIIRINDELSQCKINLKEMANTNRLFSWYSKYFGEIKRKSNLPDEEKKEYLQGLIDKIYVKYDAESKSHELTLCFRHPIVGDIYERLDIDNGEHGYNIIEGSRELVISTSKSDQESKTCINKNSKKKAVKQAFVKKIPI